MTKTKRIVSLILILVLSCAALLVLCSCLPEPILYHGDGVYAVLYDGGDATVYAFDKDVNAGYEKAQVCVVPKEIKYDGEWYTVTRIANGGDKPVELVADGGHAKEIIIPETVNSIEFESFVMNDTFDYLERITVASNNEYYTSIDGVLFTKDCGTLIMYPPAKTDKVFTLPKEVVSINPLQVNFCNKYVETVQVEEGNGVFTVIDNAIYQIDTEGLTLIYVPANNCTTLELAENTYTLGYCSLRFAHVENLYVPSSLYIYFNDLDYLHPLRYVSNIYFENESLPLYMSKRYVPNSALYFDVTREQFAELTSQND